MSWPSSSGVRPAATTSVTRGVEILPSGRTGTLVDNSGLCQTEMSSESPGPMIYLETSPDGAAAWAAAGTVAKYKLTSRVAAAAKGRLAQGRPDRKFGFIFTPLNRHGPRRGLIS